MGAVREGQPPDEGQDFSPTSAFGVFVFSWSGPSGFWDQTSVVCSPLDGTDGTLAGSAQVSCFCEPEGRLSEEGQGGGWIQLVSSCCPYEANLEAFRVPPPGVGTVSLLAWKASAMRLLLSCVLAGSVTNLTDVPLSTVKSEEGRVLRQATLKITSIFILSTCLVNLNIEVNQNTSQVHYRLRSLSGRDLPTGLVGLVGSEPTGDAKKGLMYFLSSLTKLALHQTNGTDKLVLTRMGQVHWLAHVNVIFSVPHHFHISELFQSICRKKSYEEKMGDAWNTKLPDSKHSV